MLSSSSSPSPDSNVGLDNTHAVTCIISTKGVQLLRICIGCDLQEAAYENLTAYKGLAEFFSRPLKHGVQPVDKVN
jgi:phosphatidylserine decarboxylase